MCIGSKNIDCGDFQNVEHKKCRNKLKICEYYTAKKLIDAGKMKLVFKLQTGSQPTKNSSVESVVSADSFCHNLFFILFFR